MDLFYKIRNFKIPRKNIWWWLVLLVPVAADILDIFIFDRINESFIELLSKPSFFSLKIVLLFYILFILSSFVVNLFEPDDIVHNRNNSKGLSSFAMFFYYSSLGFGLILFVIVIRIILINPGEKVFSADEQQIIMWIMLFLFFVHIFVVFMPLKPRLKIEKPAYFFTFVPVLIISMLLINLSVALWIYLFAYPEGRQVTLTTGGKVIEVLTTLPLFLIFFSSPRFMFMSREFSWLSFLSALVLIFYFILESLSYAGLF